MFGKCGDPIKNWQLALFADSDLAGCIFTKKSTTGAILVIVGDNTWLPIGAICSKQGSVATSTPHAELIAADRATRQLGVPLLAVLERITKRSDLNLTLEEDNESAIACLKAGYSHTMRELSRLHGVSLASLNNIYCRKPNSNVFKLKYCPTKKQVADVFTKSLKTGSEWWPGIRKLGFAMSPSDFEAKYDTSIDPEDLAKKKKTQLA